MQLSAPTLPFDPTASFPSDGTSRQTPGARDSGSSASADFGAILSAKSSNSSRGESNSTTPRAAAKIAAESASEREDDTDSGAFLRGPLPENNATPTDDIATQQNALASLIASAGPACVTVPLPPAELKIDLSLSPANPGTGSADAEPAVPVADSETVLTPSSRVVQGRPFIGDMLMGKAQAGIRAYGLSGERPVSRKNSKVDESDAADNAAATGTAPLPVMPELQGAVATGSTPDALVNPPATVPNETSETDGASCVPVAVSPTPSESTVTESVAIDVDQALSSPPQIENAPVVLDTTQPVDKTVSFENSVSISHEAAPEITPALTTPIAPLVDAAGAIPASTDVLVEKIAARLSRFSDRAEIPEKAAQKISVLSDSKTVVASYGRIGINAAKLETLMPATASLPTPAPVAMQNASFDPMPFSLDALVKDDSGASPQLDQVAHRAVESALAVAEQFVTGDQRSVHLQFNVGGEDLAVRVELRGDKVHTTFRTDSPELSNALAREWQTVSASQSGDRTQRLADPVFASSSSGQSTSSDSGSANQRNQGSRYGQAAEEFSAMRSSVRAQPIVTAAPVSTPALHSPASNSRRLQTFA